MNKFSLIVFLFALTIFCSDSFAQSRLIWSSVSANPNSQITDSRNFACDNSGNSYSINYTESALSLYVSYVFYAHDANGLKLWEYVNDSCLIDCNDKYFNIVPIENDGAIFIGAYDDITGTQVRVKRIDGSGTLLWEQYWISPFLSLQPIQSLLDNNGDLIIGLSAILNLTDQEDFTIAKFDTVNGYLDWHLEIPDAGTGLNTLSETITSISVDASNHIYGVGTATNSLAGIYKNYFFRVDDSGTLDYSRESSYSGINSNNSSLQLDNSGNLYTLGFTGSQPAIEKRRASSGNLIWSEEITKDSSLLSNVGFTVIGNSIYAANNFTYFNSGTSGGYWNNLHYMISKLDTSGTLRWQNQYFVDADSLATQDGYGGAVQFGICNNDFYLLSEQHLDSLNNILFLHRVDTAGNTVWYDTASIKDDAGIFSFDDQCEIYLCRTFDNDNLTEKYTTIPTTGIASLKDLAIFEIYPNPVHDEFTLQLTNAKTKEGVVRVYNCMGEVIKSESISGISTTISIRELSSGFYFVQVTTDGNEKFTKILIKN